jgi:hypothetical protein
VRSEHKLNGKPVEQGLHLPGGHPLFPEQSNGITNRFTERLGMEDTFALAQLVDTMIFLSQVDEIKISGERGRDGARRIDIQRFNLRLKLFRRFCISAPTIFRRCTNAFLNCK